MTREELTQAAIDCLGKALNGDAIRVHVVQAATSILLTGTSGTAPMPTPQPTPHPPPTPTPTPTPILPAPFPELPTGYNSDPNVAFEMFKVAMAKHGLTPTSVQGHGQWIVDSMNDTWPGWNVYLSPTDAPVVPGFGSIDCTIDSGKGGWSFRPDGATPYAR